MCSPKPSPTFPDSSRRTDRRARRRGDYPHPALSEQGRQADGVRSIEDIQGKIELAIFPRTWTQTAEILITTRSSWWTVKPTQRAEPKVLVDRITTNLPTTSRRETGETRPGQYNQELPTDRRWTVDDGRQFTARDASLPVIGTGVARVPAAGSFPAGLGVRWMGLPEPVLSFEMKPR
jgi:hypothetical protein